MVETALILHGTAYTDYRTLSTVPRLTAPQSFPRCRSIIHLDLPYHRRQLQQKTNNSRINKQQHSHDVDPHTVLQRSAPSRALSHPDRLPCTTRSTCQILTQGSMWIASDALNLMLFILRDLLILFSSSLFIHSSLLTAPCPPT